GNGTFNHTTGSNVITINGGKAGLVLANATGSAGIYNFNAGILWAPNAAEIIGKLGRGTYIQLDGANTCFSLSIADAASGTNFGPGASGTVNLSGGFLTAGSMVNNGAFNQSGGSFATLGAVSGDGTMTIGNNSGTTARANVTRFDQSSITIKSTGSLIVASNN